MNRSGIAALGCFLVVTPVTAQPISGTVTDGDTIRMGDPFLAAYAPRVP